MSRALSGPSPAVLYASGAFGFNVLHQTISLWLIYYYAPPAESGRPAVLPLALLGALMAVGRVLDAIDDPAIGHWSDVTRSRWGRRLPFIAGGAPLLVLVFVLLWLPPAGLAPWLAAVIVFLVLQLYSLSSTVVHQPYEAVLAEVARDSQTRLRVSGWKVLFGVVGAAVGLIGSGVAIGAFGFPGMAVAFGLLAGASILLSALGVRRLPAQPPHDRRVGLLDSLRLTARNGQFLTFVCSEMAFQAALSMLTALIPFFVTSLLGRPEGEVSYVTAAFFVVVLVSVPVVNRISGRWGKAAVYRLAMAALVLLMPGLFFAGSLPSPWPDPFVQVAAYVALLGLPMSAAFVLPNPMIADIVDREAERTGLRREGAYYGVEETIMKAGTALSALLFSAALSGFGLAGLGGDQTLGIRLVGPVAGALVLVGLVVFAAGCRLSEAPSAAA